MWVVLCYFWLYMFVVGCCMLVMGLLVLFWDDWCWWECFVILIWLNLLVGWFVFVLCCWLVVWLLCIMMKCWMVCSIGFVWLLMWCLWVVICCVLWVFCCFCIVIVFVMWSLNLMVVWLICLVWMMCIVMCCMGMVGCVCGRLSGVMRCRLICVLNIVLI